MTPQEHELMVQMFARTLEAVEILKDTLRSRELWTEDDEKAFSHAVHADAAKLVRTVVQSYTDYKALADGLG